MAEPPITKDNKRTQVLNQAIRISVDRAATHGSMRENMQKAADLISAYLGVKVSALDVTQIMVMLKAARIKTGEPVDEHFSDQAGYSAMGAEIVEDMKGLNANDGAFSATQQKR